MKGRKLRNMGCSCPLCSPKPSQMKKYKRKLQRRIKNKELRKQISAL